MLYHKYGYLIMTILFELCSNIAHVYFKSICISSAQKTQGNLFEKCLNAKTLNIKIKGSTYRIRQRKEEEIKIK